MFDITQINSQNGRVVIVTGANVGLGFETTKALAEKGATVIMACRSEQRASDAREQILAEIPSAQLVFLPLDLSSLTSVRAFTEQFKAQFNRLDLLINNAGVMIPPFQKTADGFELQMGVNYFGHFLLTSLLLPLLEKTAGARIVNLASIAHRRGRISFDNLNAEKRYWHVQSYAQSKLAMLMFTYELARQLKAHGYKTLAVAAHPGVSNTNLSRYIPGFLMTLGTPVLKVFSHTPEFGAKPQLYAALGEDIQSGDYTGPNGFLGMVGKPVKVKPMRHATNMAVAKKLWDVSIELTGAQWFIEETVTNDSPTTVPET